MQTSPTRCILHDKRTAIKGKICFMAQQFSVKRVVVESFDRYYVSNDFESSFNNRRAVMEFSSPLPGRNSYFPALIHAFLSINRPNTHLLHRTAASFLIFSTRMSLSIFL